LRVILTTPLVALNPMPIWSALTRDFAIVLLASVFALMDMRVQLVKEQCALTIAAEMEFAVILLTLLKLSPI